MAHGKTIDISKDNLRLGELAQPFISVGSIVAVTAILGSFFVAMVTKNEKGLQYFAFTYLHNFTFILSIALGALVFVLFQHLSKAGWSVTVRRLAEITMVTLPLMGVLLLLFLPLTGHVYHWMHEPEKLAHYVGIKSTYLTVQFLLVRVAIYIAVWSWLALKYYRGSVRQDDTGDPELTKSMERWSPVSTMLYAVTSTFFAFDFIMALDYHWFSTMFGVYYFAGSFMAFMAFLGLMLYFLQSHGRMEKAVSAEHRQDVGKFLFAFIVFWAYIAFSQYMLIWYANIPEETAWYHRRIHNGWDMIGWLLLVGHFVIPFLGLMSRWVKRHPAGLLFWSVWMLVMHWFDLYWLIMPEFSPEAMSLGIVDILAGVGFFSLLLVMVAWVARKSVLVPVRDPRLRECLAFHNI